MTTNRWCSHCRSNQPIDWREDPDYPHRERASCPRCGAAWGIRGRRPLAALIAGKNGSDRASDRSPTAV